jgi:hypothetical protein
MWQRRKKGTKEHEAGERRNHNKFHNLYLLLPIFKAIKPRRPTRKLMHGKTTSCVKLLFKMLVTKCLCLWQYRFKLAGSMNFTEVSCVLRDNFIITKYSVYYSGANMK